MTFDLIQIVDAALADATQRGGHWLACRPGCSQCCVGVFPIGWQDADRLRDGLIALGESDPERAARVRARTTEALTRLDPWFPGDVATGVLGESYEAAILFEEFANNEPCPALDLDHGTCDLYETRPVLCRTFGPPMRTEEGNLATCELCFIGADTEEIARCELDPKIPAIEAEANATYEAATERRGETLIAYALRGA
ncbi:YkgJ family cysteine cluster protein [Granulicella arctica]|uniref:Fe-S-cluster containining protein n=1 Tax=Granulicella arctica TaxID=940613 RepID=A0A7Y9PJJ0_9BACT|nr:YkgJ family cysteine cluster protein [Granulicella arctica]NYF81083.1 Fe-S-cluster containining protein [Granulicella arctica]